MRTITLAILAMALIATGCGRTKPTAKAAATVAPGGHYAVASVMDDSGAESVALLRLKDGSWYPVAFGDDRKAPLRHLPPQPGPDVVSIDGQWGVLQEKVLSADNLVQTRILLARRDVISANVYTWAVVEDVPADVDQVDAKLAALTARFIEVK